MYAHMQGHMAVFPS